jgi:hypothetical protein
MKQLTITYDGKVIFDGGVEEFAWSDKGSSVSVTGKTKAGNPGGFLDLLAAAAKKQTEANAEDRKMALDMEKREMQVAADGD